ncbi:MAG: hypothetical protein HKN30_00510 [Sulfitobacter sp.]|nr:hypothetical protein [Sulfitobacter sp.]
MYLDTAAATYFKVFEDGTRRLVLTQRSFMNGSWALRRHATHEFAHAQQFRFELLRQGHNFRTAYRRWTYALPERVAWQKIIAERLALQRTIRGTGMVDFHVGRRSAYYVEHWRNQLRNPLADWEYIFPWA